MLEAVFVHLGEKLPEHLIANLQIVKSNFPTLKLHLVLNNSLALRGREIPHVEIHVLKVSEEIEKILSELSPDPKFRSGFWRLTLERLFILEKFHELKGNLRLLHIESDVFLFPNFPIQRFEALEEVSWLKVSSSRDAAALVYLPTPAQTSRVVSRMIEELKLGKWLDDMEMLSTIMKKYPDEYRYLPGLNPSHKELQSPTFDSSHIEKELTSNFQVFEGIFDAAHLGIWLTGWDPRNSYGFTRVRDSTRISDTTGLLKPENVNFHFDELNCLKYVNGSKSTDIYSLHIHSKSMKIFSTEWACEFERLVNGNLRYRKIVDFSPKTLIELLIMNNQNGTLTRYIMNSNQTSRRISSIIRTILHSLTNRRNERA